MRIGEDSSVDLTARPTNDWTQHVKFETAVNVFGISEDQCQLAFQALVLHPSIFGRLSASATGDRIVFRFLALHGQTTIPDRSDLSVEICPPRWIRGQKSYQAHCNHSEDRGCNSLRIRAAKTELALACQLNVVCSIQTSIRRDMDELALEQLQRNPKWTSILDVYNHLSSLNRAQSTEFDGWTARVQGIAEIPDDELPGIHGKLIAFGFLKFDLAGRDLGIRYQLTPLGRQAINGLTVVDAE